MSERIEVGGLKFELRLSSRRRTLAVTVDRGGELIAHAPVSVDLDEVREFVRSRLLWVHRKLNLKRELVRQPPALAWVTGQGIYYMGRSYRLRLIEKADVPLDLRAGWWELRHPDQRDAVAHFRRWFITNGAAWTADRVSGLPGPRSWTSAFRRVTSRGLSPNSRAAGLFSPLRLTRFLAASR